MAMLTQAKASSLTPPRLRVPEKDDDCVADVLVDRRPVIERDPGHFRQVLVEQLGQLLGFQAVGRFGKTSNIREEHRQFLALAGDLDLLAAGENRFVDLRRQILCELIRELLQRTGFFRKLLFALFQLRDV